MSKAAENNESAGGIMPMFMVQLLTVSEFHGLAEMPVELQYFAASLFH